jgi:hypothetical protein
MISERVRQLREASLPPSDEDYALAREHLSPPLEALFAAQHPRDIRHSAGTARWLLERGFANPDLMVAAFLHDVAKGHQRRRDRVVYVAASHLGLARPVAAETSAWAVRRAVARSLTHARESARRMKENGASERAVDLALRHHGSARDDPVLALLQRADAES